MNRNIYISTYENNKLLFKTTTVALVEDNFLSYNTDNDKIEINIEPFSFTKENKESRLRIKERRCTLTLKEENITMDIPLEWITFKNEENKIEIEYKLISQEYPLKLEIEIGDIKNEI